VTPRCCTHDVTQDSSQLGAGYEPSLKGSNGVVKKAGSKPASKAGTKKVKAAKSGTKSGATSPLASLFGSKDE